MDVALIQWPTDQPLRAELAELSQPRLLLVEPDAEPPVCIDLHEDWVRLPVSMEDRIARIRMLESRVERPLGSAPGLREDGTLEFRGSVAQLSAVQAELMRPLVERFGAVVSREVLTASAWPDGDRSHNNLDVAISRLRRQVARVDLTIRTVRSRGYVLTAPSPDR